MTYYDHATMIALRLGPWAEDRNVRRAHDEIASRHRMKPDWSLQSRTAPEPAKRRTLFAAVFGGGSHRGKTAKT